MIWSSLVLLSGWAALLRVGQRPCSPLESIYMEPRKLSLVISNRSNFAAGVIERFNFSSLCCTHSKSQVIACLLFVVCLLTYFQSKKCEMYMSFGAWKAKRSCHISTHYDPRSQVVACSSFRHASHAVGKKQNPGITVFCTSLKTCLCLEGASVAA